MSEINLKNTSDDNGSVRLADEDRSGICFRDDAFLQHYALANENVLDYFALSPFYERSCNNELCKMQRMDYSHLLDMVGIEYVLHASELPYLFVVRKQRRESRDVATPLELYYIIDGTIYVAPDALRVLVSRVEKSRFFAAQSLRALRPHATFSPEFGYHWDTDKTVTGVPKAEQEIRARIRLQFQESGVLGFDQSAAAVLSADEAKLRHTLQAAVHNKSLMD